MTSRLRLLSLAAVAAAALAPPALAAPAGTGATCHGLPVTVSGHRGEVVGTPRADVIRLTAAGTVRSGAGDDIVCGSPQPDRILSGAGDDIVLGGGGADVIRSGSGRDHVYGEAGADHIHGGHHRDVLVPGAGWDAVSAGDLDSVEPGPYAVSIALTTDAVQQLAMSGLKVGLSRPGAGTTTPLWSTFPPLMQTSVTVGDYAVFSARGPLVPNAVVLSESVSTATLGSSWTFQDDGVFTPSALSPGPDAIQVMNAGAAGILGLEQAVSVNGSTTMGPVSATEALPNEVVTLTPSPSVTVFPVGWVPAGTLLSGTPQGAVTVTPTPERPTRTITWNGSGFVALG